MLQTMIARLFYTIKRVGLLMQNNKTKITQTGKTLSEDKHSIFIKYSALLYVIGATINFMRYLDKSTSLLSVILFSTIYILIGIVLFRLPNLGLSVKVQDIILTIALASTIPLTLFRFMNDAAGNVVWPVALIITMITIVFDNNWMFISVAITTIVTGLLSWLFTPDITIEIDSFDYFARLLFYIMTFALANYINKIYIARLKENDQYLAFQTMITNISADFVTVTQQDFDEKVRKMLKDSGEFTNADSSYLVLLSEENKKLSIRNQWHRETITSSQIGLKNKNQVVLKWCMDQVSNDQVVCISELETIPIEEKNEKEALLKQNICSLLLVPIFNKDKAIGFIGFIQVLEKKEWPIQDHNILMILSNLIIEAINKIEIEKEINYLAYYDALTGLPNRTLFNNRLEQAIQLAKRMNEHVGVLFIDLDGFKSINDSLGHESGDNLLKSISARLSACMRKYDTVSRFGGDEFLIMIPQISTIKDIEAVAKKIMTIFLKPILLNEQVFYITASIGISIFPMDGEEINALIKNADLAMYQSKNNGKNRFTFCSGDMKIDIFNKMILTNALYRALERDEFTLYYQPQVRIKDNSIIGFEALIRWDHPELGRIAPSVFIPIAEQIGLINSIGEWIINTACKQNKTWQEKGYKPVQMAVNISLEQFKSGDLYDIVRNCLLETKLDAKYLELEITEGIAMKESEEIIKTLIDLKLLGVSVAIDDFGIEYSSLSRLKDLPIDRLKMDIQFIRGIAVNSKDESIIKVIIHLAKSLGLKVIAEGVETKTQLQFLEEASCDEVQGYYYYKPLTKDEVEIEISKTMLIGIK